MCRTLMSSQLLTADYIVFQMHVQSVDGHTHTICVSVCVIFRFRNH